MFCGIHGFSDTAGGCGTKTEYYQFSAFIRSDYDYHSGLFHDFDSPFSDSRYRGNNLVYLGSVFTPMLLLFSVVRLCRRRTNHALSFFLILLAGVILFFSFSIGESTAFTGKSLLWRKTAYPSWKKNMDRCTPFFPYILHYAWRSACGRFCVHGTGGRMFRGK